MRPGTHRVDDHGIVGVDAEYADLQHVAVMGGTDAHREVVVQLPLRDGVTSRVKHVVVCDAVLSSSLRDAHETTRYLVRTALSRNLVGGPDDSDDRGELAPGVHQRPMTPRLQSRL